MDRRDHQASGTSVPPESFRIGQKVRVERRGRAEIAQQILPGLWAVNFLDLEGFGYVFEAEMSR